MWILHTISERTSKYVEHSGRILDGGFKLRRQFDDQIARDGRLRPNVGVIEAAANDAVKPD